MLTPSLGGRERIDFSHKARNGHRESISVPRDPGPSISTFDSDVGYLGRAMHELFTPMTSEVTSAWDAGFQFFHPPPPPPPPPRHRRSSTLWDISAAVPKERPENGCEVHWSNPYGPDPPSEVAPPAAKPMIEDSFQKATKLSAISSSSREEGYRPDSTVAEDIEPMQLHPPNGGAGFLSLGKPARVRRNGWPACVFHPVRVLQHARSLVAVLVRTNGMSLRERRSGYRGLRQQTQPTSTLVPCTNRVPLQ